MSRQIYIRRSQRDAENVREPWDPKQGITEEEWNQEGRIIKETEELHFFYDRGEDATELRDYIYEKLHLSSNFWDVCQKEYPQFLEKFGTPIGIELSILYFAIKRSWSGDYDNDDTGIPMKALKDVNEVKKVNEVNDKKEVNEDRFFWGPRDSQYWRDNLIEIDEDLLRDTLHDLPLLPELCRDVYAFFLFQFSRHTFVPYQPDVDIEHENERVAAWIVYLKELLNSVKEVISTSTSSMKAINLIARSRLEPVVKWRATEKGRFLSQIHPDTSPPDLARAYSEKLSVTFETLKRVIHKERNNELKNSKMNTEDAKAALRTFLNE